MEFDGAHDRPFDVVGVANILPVDHVYTVSAGSVASAFEALRRSPPQEAHNPTAPFTYESYQRTGGGRVANILAYLGRHGHRVAAIGAVGGDIPGEVVRKDLRDHKVDVTHVVTQKNHRTRVVFILKSRTSLPRQFHVKATPLASMHKDQLQRLPSATVLLLGRANSNILSLAREAKANGTKIAFEIGDAPHWDSEFGACKKLVEIADVAVISRRAARALKLAPTSGLLVTYNGMNAVEACWRQTERCKVEASPFVAISDRTGMQDCFLGALLSFLLWSEWRANDTEVVKAALHFANEIAAFSGTGMGARHFPLAAQDLLIRARHWASIKRRRSIFVSHSSRDTHIVAAIKRRLMNEPGFKVWVNDAKPGDTVWSALETAINSSNIFLIVITEQALDSPWVKLEALHAVRRKTLGRLRIVPVVVAGNTTDTPRLWTKAVRSFGLPKDLVYLDGTLGRAQLLQRLVTIIR